MHNIKKYIKFISSKILPVAYIAIFIYIVITTRYTIGYSKDLLLQYIIIGIIQFIILDKNIAKKKNITFTKLDALMVILCFSSLMPIVFQTAASLESAIMAVIKYIAILQMYFMAKYIVSSDSKNRRIIINLFIFTAIMFSFIGIDKMTTNRFNLLSFDINRLESLFYSGNTLAAVIVVAILLSLGELGESTKKSAKAVYLTIVFVLTASLIITYSRLMYVAFGLVIILYWIITKDSNHRKQIAILMALSIILGVCYSNYYSKVLITRKYYQIWLGLALEVIIGILLYWAIYKKSEMLISKKKWIIAAAVVLAIVSIFYCILLGKISESILMFGSSNSNQKYEKVIRNIKPNTNYSIEFDIEANCTVENTFEIIVEERNKFQDYVESRSFKFGKYNGKKEINFTTQENTTDLYIIFLTTECDETARLMVKRVYINGLEQIFNYKYLPTKLVDKIKNFNIHNKSAWERISFYKDAGKLIKENWFSGIGGDCWKYRYTEQQSYNYVSTEVHSYPIQIFLEFGILGLIAYIGIVISIIKKLLLFTKTKEKSNIGIGCAIICILLHSCLDYDMSFLYVIIMVYSLIALIDNDEGKKIDNKFSKFINIGLIFITAITILCNLTQFLYKISEKKIDELPREKQASIYNDLTKVLPYNCSIRMKCLRRNEEWIEQCKYLFDNEAYYFSEEDSFFIYTLNDYILNSLETNQIENLESLQRFYQKTRLTKKFFERYQINRLSSIIVLGDYLMEYGKNNNDEKLIQMAQEVYASVIEEINDKKEAILDYENGRFPKRNVEYYEKELQSVYDTVNSKLENNL